jgi:hypothetical protein
MRRKTHLVDELRGVDASVIVRLRRNVELEGHLKFVHGQLCLIDGLLDNVPSPAGWQTKLVRVVQVATHGCHVQRFTDVLVGQRHACTLHHLSAHALTPRADWLVNLKYLNCDSLFTMNLKLLSIAIF